MDIYQLTDDFAYKTFTIIGEKVEYITLNGQPLIGSWKEKQGEVYKNYDNKGKKDGFDARICGGLFVMEKEKAILFVQRTNVKAELLPFKTTIYIFTKKQVKTYYSEMLSTLICYTVPKK